MKKIKNIIQDLLDESENLSDVLFMAGGGGGRQSVKKGTEISMNNASLNSSKK